jgi:sialate O-acetylesterase
MLAPILPFRIKGVIWYQGENNVDRPIQYRKLFPALIESWRSERRQEGLPFYYVQIAPFRYTGEKKSASLLREAQTMALALPNTGMVVTADIGNLDDVHPRNKQDVGKRLALLALAKSYGETQIAYSGPALNSIKKEEKRIRLFFDHAETGLVVKGGSLKNFEIAGKDHIFYPAIAGIEDTTIVVYNNKVINPQAVRYGWDIDTIVDLYNGAGLPAVPFRTDNW